MHSPVAGTGSENSGATFLTMRLADLRRLQVQLPCRQEMMTADGLLQSVERCLPVCTGDGDDRFNCTCQPPGTGRSVCE